jgi:hypothetical protein
LVGLVPLITSSFFCLKKYTIIGCNFSWRTTTPPTT